MSQTTIRQLGHFYACAAIAVLVCALTSGTAEELPVIKVGSEVYRPEKLPLLKVGGEVYSNVTVTSITATDIYFGHAQGIGNAKIKNLEPEIQKHFGYNAAKAGQAEQNQRNANTRYREDMKNAAAKAAPAAKAPAGSDKAGETTGRVADDDLVVPKIHARSFRGQPSPQIIVDQWLTSSPDVKGKFVLVDFWATWCGPCREAIPHLNQLQAKFKDRLVVIGLSNESPEAVRKMKSPKMEYAVGTDPQARTSRAVEVAGIPHAMLIDPGGVVRFEGMPGYLTEEALARLITKYSE
jgi:cytochrome c biogenesis protein CcmG/thiol:disulfide interchange protein DsbE